MTISNHKSITQLFVTTILLLITVSLAIFKFDLEISRTVTFSATLVLFIFFLIYKGVQSRVLLITFIFLLLRDLAMLRYELEFPKTLSFAFTFFAYLGFIFYALRSINIKLFQKEMFVFVLLIVGLNIFNLYYLSDTVTSKLDNNIQETLFYVQGALILFLGLVAFLYNDAYYGRRVLMYQYVVICLVFSDLSGLLAYFFDVAVAFYPQKLTYLAGVSLMVYMHLISVNSGFAALREREDSFV